MNMSAKLLNTITESKSPEELLSGKVFHPSDVTQDELDKLIEDNDFNLFFTCDPKDVEEIHAYDIDVVLSMDRHSAGSWPIISKQGSLFKLESSFGYGKESYIICKSASVTKF